MHSKNNEHTVIISGSSITDSRAWPTWAYYVRKVFGWSDVVDTSIKGLGNEYILLRAIDQAKKAHNPFLLVQLTTTDKWDWYVDRKDLVEELSKEKHPLLPINKNKNCGFWSTGSHFPLHKEYYRENYYSQDYFVWKTLSMIQWFRGVCAKHNWKYYILFDSPIFAVTEEQLNQNLATYQEIDSFLKSPLSSIAADLWDFDDVYMPGLIGYAKSKNLPWWSEKFKGHPGSLVHWYFSRDIVIPELQKHFVCKHEIGDLLDEANTWQKLIDQV